MNSAHIMEEDKASINVIKLDVSANLMNSSIKTLFCNHCQMLSNTIEEMKSHYKSDLHRYNLTRITSNLRPLTQEEFDKKKAHFESLKKNTDKKAQTKANNNPLDRTDGNNYYCSVCRKAFASQNKLNEHLVSKTHLNAIKTKETSSGLESKEKRIKDNPKTTLDDLRICIFCNENSNSLEENYQHMKIVHHLDIPLESYLKDIESCVKLMAKKVFTYKACLGCDSQNFENVWSLQNHIIDKQHSYINLEDLEDHLYFYYDVSKLSEVKDNNIRLTKAYKILRLKLKLNRKEETKKIKEINDEEEEYDIDDSIDEPIELPNGELLLQSGKVVGNKFYNLYYKQRVKINRFEGVMSTREFEIKMKRLNFLRKLINKQKFNKNHFKRKITDKKKNIMRQNTLFRACKQVNV